MDGGGGGVVWWLSVCVCVPTGLVLGIDTRLLVRCVVEKEMICRYHVRVVRCIRYQAALRYDS